MENRARMSFCHDEIIDEHYPAHGFAGALQTQSKKKMAPVNSLPPSVGHVHATA